MSTDRTVHSESTTSTTSATSTSAPVTPPPGLPAPARIPGRRPWRRSIEVRFALLLVVLAVDALLHAWNVVNDMRGRALLGASEFDAFVELVAASEPIQGLSVLLAAAVVAALAAWIHGVWTSDRSDPYGYTRSTGKAVGGVFIPFATYVLTPLTLRDLWRGTSAARPGADSSDVSLPMPGLVIAYGLTWGGANVVLAISRGLTSSAERAVDLDTALDRAGAALLAESIGSVLVVLAAVLLAFVVQRIMSMARR